MESVRDANRWPVFGSLSGYRRKWLSGDLIAGLTVWAVLAPEALAYASIAGVSPVVGLYAAPGALLLYAAVGSSRHLIVGPMSATAALSAAAVAELATGGSDSFLALTVALAITTGIVAVIAGLLRFGFVASFISEPVLKGFIVGLALTIIAGQLPKLFGVESEGHNFFTDIGHLISHLGETNGRTLAVGLVSLAIVFLTPHWWPRLPVAMIAVIVGIAASRAFDLAAHGVALVGHVQSGLPHIGLPQASGADYLKLVPSAIGIMLVAFAEGLAAAKSYAAKSRYEIDPSRELLAVGASNLASGLCGGMVVGGSLSKTAVNGSAGARTQLSGLVAALLIIPTLLFLTGLFEDLPEATLAAVVIAAVVQLVDISSLGRFYRLGSGPFGSLASRPDFAGAIAALVGVLAFDTLPGLFIGIGISLLLLLYRASRPGIAELGRVPGTDDQYSAIDRFPDNITIPGVIVLRVDGGLFFANADTVRDRLRAEATKTGVRAIVLDGESSPFVDLTAIRMLQDVSDQLERSGVRLVLSHELGGVRESLSLAQGASSEFEIYPTVSSAVAAMGQHASVL